MKNEVKSMLGFESPSDFFTTLFGWHYNIINAFVAFVAALTTFITSYIWDSSAAVFTLMSLMLCDWVIGVTLAIRATLILKYGGKLTSERKAELNKRKFSSKKAPRIFVAIPLAFWILSISWNLSKANPLYYPLPGIVYGGFTGTYLMSLWENLTELGFFSKDFLALIKDKFDVTKYFKK